MTKIDKLDLLGGQPINHCGVTLKPPKLSDIKEIGNQKYLIFLNTLLFTKETVIEIIKGYKNITKDDLQNLTDITLFEIVMKHEELRSLLLQAISFFVCDFIYYDDERTCICSNEKALIDKNNYIEIRNGILEMNGITNIPSSKEEMNLENDTAKRIQEKIEKGRSKFSSSNKNSTISFSEMISKVLSQNYGYTLFNIWDLTVYQLYEAFRQATYNLSLNLAVSSWAAHPINKFDFSIWDSTTKNKGDL